MKNSKIYLYLTKEDKENNDYCFKATFDEVSFSVEFDLNETYRPLYTEALNGTLEIKTLDKNQNTQVYKINSKTKYDRTKEFCYILNKIYFIEYKIELNLPIFKALSVESDMYKAGIEVKGDFIYTPAWTNKNGLEFAESFEIWERNLDSDYPYQIDIDTLELSLDNGETWGCLKDLL